MYGSYQLRRRLGVALVVLLASLAAPSLASAAPLNGQLKQLPLAKGGCLANGSAGGCKNVTFPMTGIGEPAMSPDGRFLYVPARSSNTVITFERNLATGELTERACFRYPTAASGCTAATPAPTPVENVTRA